MGQVAAAGELGGRLLRPRTRGQPKSRGRAEPNRHPRSLSRRRTRRLDDGARGARPQAAQWFDALAHARAPEDRSHRLPVADRAFRRSGGTVSLCAVQGGARRGEGQGGGALRHSGRALLARRSALQLRRLPQALPPERSGAQGARHDRPRRRHRQARARAAGPWAGGDFARAFAQLPGRPRDAQARHGDVRRSVYLVQGRQRRAAHLEPAGVPPMTLAYAYVAIAALSAAAQAPLEPVATIPMPGVKGRIDHFAIDVKAHRLFVAALGNDTVEVLDVAANRHEKSIAGFGEPQGLVHLPQSNRLFVANGSANRVDILDARSLSTVKRIEQLDDADNLRYDAAAGKIIVGYGKGALRLMDADSGDPAGEIRLAGHPESFQLEARGTRAFVNVPTAQHVAVVDRVKRQVTATWPVAGATSNFPMALDEAGRRLFVGARAPAVMLVYDIDSGKIVAKLPIGGDTDDIFFDASRKRVYVICGEGRVDVFRQETADQYSLESSIKTAPRARTGLFVPEDAKLYVAAPSVGSAPARVLVYAVR